MNAHPLMVSTQVTIARMLAHRCASAVAAPDGYSLEEREIRALAEVLNSEGEQPAISAHIAQEISEGARRALVAYLAHDRSGEVRITCERMGLVVAQ